MNTKSAMILAASLGVSILALAGPSGQPSVSMPVTELKYGPTGVTDGVHGELNAAAAYGDLAHGAHGTFIKMLPVGSYWFQKGGEAQVTKCLSPNECIFFISQNGKFAYVKVGG